MGSTTLIVKATRLCNLRCNYCHDWRVGNDQTMTFPVMARLIASALRDPYHNQVDFIWHGGEPTILPISFYEKVLLLQSRFQRPGQEVRNQIQTNCTLLTHTLVQFLHDNEFGISISLDGPPEIHDQYRRYASGKPSFDDVIRNINLLHEYKIPISALMVIDESALKLGPDRIFDFFIEMGIMDYGLLAATPTNQPNASPGTPTEHYVDRRKMNSFLMQIYDRWIKNGDPRIHIRELDLIRNRIATGTSNCCTLSGECFGNFYLIEPNGEVAHCDVFSGDSFYTLGNIVKEDFAALRSNSRMHALQEEHQKRLEHMRQCPEFSICNGGCPHESYLSTRHSPNHQSNCCGLRDLISHIRNNMPDNPGELYPNIAHSHVTLNDAKQ